MRFGVGLRIFSCAAALAAAALLLDACSSGHSGTAMVPAPVQHGAQSATLRIASLRETRDVLRSTATTAHDVSANGAGRSIRSGPGAYLHVTPLYNELKSLTALTTPSAIAYASNGYVWVGQNSSTIVRITTGTIASTNYTIGTGSTHSVGGIAVDASNNVWFTDPAAQAYGEITSSGTVSEWAVGSTYGNGMNGIAIGPDGNPWIAVTTSNVLLQVSATTPSSATVYSVAAGVAPAYAAQGPGSTLWFTGNGYLVRIGFTGSTPTAMNTSSTGGSGYGSIIKGPDGNMWFADPVSTAVDKLTLSTTYFASSLTSYGVAASPGGLAKGNDSDIYFTEPSANTIVGLNPGTSSIDFTQTARSASSSPTPLATSPDGSLWWAEAANGVIGTYGDSQNGGAVYVSTALTHGWSWGPAGAGDGLINANPYGGGSITGFGDQCGGSYYFSPNQSVPNSGTETVGVTFGSYDALAGNSQCGYVVKSTYGDAAGFLPV